MQKNKYFLFLILSIFISNCGFSPMYKEMTNIKFNISLMELNGNRDMNNLIKSNLNRYSNITDAKVFEIKVSTIYTKSSIAKDTTGKTTDYRIKLVTKFEIKKDELLKEITINESFDYSSIDNSFDQLKYEQTVKQNIVNTTVKKLISQLTRLQ
jgi:hypothetical protein